jgi:galactokinase
MDRVALEKTFFELYGNTEEKPALYFAPGRVNLIGEHTDYNGGFVLPCALQYGTYLLIRPNDDNVLRFTTSNFPFRADIPIHHVSQKLGQEWVNYPMGIFEQFTRRLSVPNPLNLSGFDMLFSGDIPNSAGLSSSASIEMVTAFALNDLLGPGMEMIDLVKLSKASENEFIGVNCGIMDMFVIGNGAAGFALFLNCLTLEHKLVPVVLDGFSLVIVNTNKQRGLTESKYNERVEECHQALEALSTHFPARQLGEISYMQFYKIQEVIEDEVIRRRARHVISENQRVLNSVNSLWKGDLQQFGAFMNASHDSLRDNYEVTGTELDTLAEEARKINGVLGARMTGAGFGGCTVNVVKDTVIDEFMERVGEAYHSKTGLIADFYIAIISDGVRKI